VTEVLTVTSDPYLLAWEEVIEREYTPLKHILDNWQKYVVSMDRQEIPPHEGVLHVYIEDLEEVL
jgi:hypothetical protein